MGVVYLKNCITFVIQTIYLMLTRNEIHQWFLSDMDQIIEEYHGWMKQMVLSTIKPLDSYELAEKVKKRWGINLVVLRKNTFAVD